MLLALGWIATCLYILAQAYLSFVASWRQDIFYGANIIAGVFLTVSSVALQSWQAVAVNVFWVGVSILALRRSNNLSTFPVRIDWILLGTAAIAIAGLTAITISLELSADIIGWSGTVLFCGAYLSFAATCITRRKYLILNATAACILLPSYYYAENWPSFILNVVWIGVSLVGWWHLHRAFNTGRV